MDNEGDLIEFKPREIEGPLCGMGRNLVAITAEGNIQACMRMPIPLGNIYKDSIIKVWETSEKLKELRNLSRKDMVKCKACSLIDYCFICPGLQFLNKNNFREPYEEACENAALRKKQYEDAKK
jgi:radical SAM protein with 4Fe4S-binding SPASM domain